MKPLIFNTLENEVVHISGNEEITGTKNFNTAPQIANVNIPSDTDAVHKSGDETINGTKTFNTTIIGNIETANKIGTSTIGDTNTPVYVSNGVVTSTGKSFENYLPLSGGLLSNTLYINHNNNAIQNNSDTYCLKITGGTASATGTEADMTGGSLFLWGKNHSANPSCFSLVTGDGTSENCYQLKGYPSGVLKWAGSNVITAAGDTMTGLLTLQANQYTDSYTGALNCANSNIYGVNSIYTSDLSDNAAEGLSFYRTSTTVDTIWAKNGVFYFTPNRTLGTAGTNYTVLTTANNIANGCVPVGTVIWRAKGTTPSGYLYCNGGKVSRTTYATLFGVIGTIYGTGDGSTTFTLPNLVNKFVMGNGTPGTVKAAGLPNITGTSGKYIAVNTTNSGALSFTDTTISGAGFGGAITSLTNRTTTFNASNSNSIYGNSSTVQPPALTLVPYIKY